MDAVQASDAASFVDIFAPRALFTPGGIDTLFHGLDNADVITLPGRLVDECHDESYQLAS
jgi:hypothetical protein